MEPTRRGTITTNKNQSNLEYAIELRDEAIRECAAATRERDALTDSRHELLAVLERLDTSTAFDDSHSPYYTFNEDDADAIRAAIALVKGGE